ncbi:SDR family NAD(P)-dependent oxidoreductase [soil metagenome]
MTVIHGRVAVVTGGASGIGRGVAEALIAAGATVVIADIDGRAADIVAAEIGATGMVCDVADVASVQALADAVVARFGGVGIIVNNAGVGSGAPIGDMTEGDWSWLLGINLFGVINGVRVFLPLLRANPTGGHLVNTASMAAFAPTAGLGGYAASKAAVVALSEVLADELDASDSDVKVTVLAPGPTRTAIASSLRHRADAAEGTLADVDLERAGFDWIRWMTPEQVGTVVVRAIENNDRYALTHPDLYPRVEARNRRLREAFERYPAITSD